jgi:hypothetical protein
MPRIRPLLWIAILVSVSACHRDDGLARVEVHGKVLYQGTPVEHGQISFRPSKGAGGPAAGAAIFKGAYTIPIEKGPTIGPHDVEVKIVDISPNASKPGDTTAMTHGITQVNSFSEHVDVTRGPNEFDFSLTPQPGPARH